MISILYFFLAIIVGYAYYNYRCLVRNIAAAKSSGIPYVVVPIYTFNFLWLTTHRLWLPSLKRLPKAWTSPWLTFMDPEWVWTQRFEPFADRDSPAFMVVAPGWNTLFVADPEATTQITSRKGDFPKPIELYTSVNLFGGNVVGTEGSIWRHHRKITAPPFTAKNNMAVFKESLHQAQTMLQNWVGRDGNTSKTVHTLAEDTMRLSLHVISKAGFGQHLLWPHEEAGAGQNVTSSAYVPPGHTLSYKDALSTLLHNIIWVMLMPHWLLSRLPFRRTQVAWESFVEWGKYMNEIYQAKKSEVQSGKGTEETDLMDALVRGAGITSDTLKIGNGDSKKGQTNSGNALSDDEIIGNMFVFILAGHETAANTIHYSLLFLAMHPKSQGHLQADLDKNGFSTKAIDEWDYEDDVPKLSGGMTGAVMNEELRLIPPVSSIPKCTHSAQPLTIAGRRCIVPSNTFVNLVAVAAGRNPHAWDSSGPEMGLNDFKPERWILNNTNHSTSAQYAVAFDKPTDEDDTENYGGPHGSDTSSTLLHPPKGAFIPFSDGPRACLGRRFAQVEILAVLAVIFRDYSVELAVDEWATDEEVAKMPVGGVERKRVWLKAKERAENLFRWGMGTIITNQMRKGHVPVRLVRKGEERFVF